MAGKENIYSRLNNEENESSFSESSFFQSKALSSNSSEEEHANEEMERRLREEWLRFRKIAKLRRKIRKIKAEKDRRQAPGVIIQGMLIHVIGQIGNLNERISSLALIVDHLESGVSSALSHFQDLTHSGPSFKINSEF